MSQNITKISENELSEIRMLRSKFQEMVFRFGELHIEKLELDKAVNNFVEKEKKLTNDWITLQKLEKDLLDKMVQKYGEGSLNPEDGTFTSTVART